jgi:hypothetical protein
MLSKLVLLYVVAALAAGAMAMADVRPRMAHSGGTSPRANLRRLERCGLAGDVLAFGRSELKMVMVVYVLWSTERPIRYRAVAGDSSVADLGMCGTHGVLGTVTLALHFETVALLSGAANWSLVHPIS